MKDVAIIADLHADSLSPECRTDTYLDALCTKLAWLMKNFRHIIIAGDVFNRWKVDPYIINRLFSVWDDRVKVYAVPGQHDLPQHSLSLIEQTSFLVMVNAGAVIRLSPTCPVDIAGWLVYGAGWGEIWPHCPDTVEESPCLLVAHKSTWMEPYAPGQTRGDAARLLLAYPGWKGIVVGDNHKTFVVQAKDRTLVSPGSVMRMRVDQMKHQPSAFTLKTHTVDPAPIIIPHAADCMTSERHDHRVTRDARIEGYVERLGQEKEVGLSFKDNMVAFLAANPVEKNVSGIISECMGE